MNIDNFMNAERNLTLVQNIVESLMSDPKNEKSTVQFWNHRLNTENTIYTLNSNKLLSFIKHDSFYYTLFSYFITHYIM